MSEKSTGLVYRPKGLRDDAYHQTHEWQSGQRGGGSVPADFSWKTNPKQLQEELGAGGADELVTG